jgi:hypothetical protein
MQCYRDYAAMSDPDKNPQFRRFWIDPPDPDKRKRRPGGGGASKDFSNTNNSAGTIAGQVRRLQDAWGIA